MLPFLLVLSIFLGGRMATRYEINRRFILIIITTLAAACFEVVLELFTSMTPGASYMKIFYALININAYCLMCYVAAYTRVIGKKFLNINFFLLALSIVMLFMLGHQEKIYTVFSPGFAILFVFEGFCLQLVHQEYYGNGQFIVMNFLFILLIDSFLLQYLFDQNVPLVYTIATMMLVFTFFYMEAPTYRKLIEAHKETDEARLMAERSIERATLANKTKSNFLASTSHEIRTPMNAILGINDMMIGELAETRDSESQKAAQNIRKAGNYLLTLVNNILDISKIEAGKMDLYESDYHLYELLKECEGYSLHKIKSKPVKFILEADKNMPEHLFGDILRLKQALINLLDNAAKYTRQGSIVFKIASEQVDAYSLKIFFTIQDTGLGMREEESQNIFEPFERANITETRNILGAGLGLTLVKNIIDIMNGKISIESKYGEGTKVSLTIPQKISRGESFTIGEYEEFITNEKLRPPKPKTITGQLGPKQKF
ncbi:MAG: hypothetical protein IJR94_00190 [Synergistaceae bacterium]|nr:hypothetical protein [Synergistaceae bacterium]